MPVHAVTIALSAFLLFLVQPIIARQILPWFGGSAAVWTTCMVFFQAALLAGYAYSDVLVRRLALRWQVAVHVVLLAVSLAALPIIAPGSMKPAAATNPWGRVVMLLAITIGLPYFLLSTTGPLMQAWAARRRAGDRVYRLYGLSNAASIVGLASYPFLVEPVLSVRAQAQLWSYGYAAFVLSAMCSAVIAWRTSEEVTPGGPQLVPSSTEGADEPPERKRLAVVLILAALGSVVLLTITSHMTRDVAPIPFLWLLPLLLYLLSFVICFDGRDSYRRTFWVPVTAALLVAMLLVDVVRPLELRLSLPVHAIGLFAACMTCHGEMVLRRPGSRFLTSFYLMVAMGGALGGILVAIVAPLVFDANLELPLALCAVAAVLYVTTPGRLRFVGAAALLVACGLAALLVSGMRNGAVALSRNFYGSLKISRETNGSGGDLMRLLHGVTLHGQQVPSSPGRRLPTSYYGETSGIGRTLLTLRPENLRVGVVGLGVGTLAAYGRRGDVFRFYELDPDVERHARSTFTYVEDSEASVEVVIGDGRLALEMDRPQDFDVIVVDAFSSDSIPMHLLTREALGVYQRHLRESGVIAFHVSNRYLDLAPIVRSLADTAGMVAWRIADAKGDRPLMAASIWVIVTKNAALLERFAVNRIGAEVPARYDLRPWTDDHSNLFRVVRLWSGEDVL